MPRPRKDYIRTNWKLSLPAPVAAQVDLLLFNPLTNKPTYGDRSNLVKGLLENWLANMSPEMTDGQGRVRLPLPTAGHIRFVVGSREVSFAEIASALSKKEPSHA